MHARPTFIFKFSVTTNRKMAFRPHDKRHREMQEDVKPPNSRLFILCGKGIREDTFRDAFGKFGTVEDIWIVKDRRTMEEKGWKFLFSFSITVH